MPVDLSAAQALQDRLNTGTKVQYLKLKEGKYTIRILPPPEGMPLPWKEFKQVSNVGPNQKIVTPPHQYDPSLPNPIAEEILRLEGLGDEASLSRAKDMRERTTYALFVIERGHEGKGPQLWMASQKHIQDLLVFFANPDAGGDISDPVNGRDLFITITPDPKKMFRNRPVLNWKFGLKMNPSPLGNPEWIAEDLFEKHRVGRPSDVDYIRACLAGTESEWLEQRKADRQAEREERQAAETETPAQGASANLPKNDAAVKAKLDEIRKKATQRKVTEGESDLDGFLA